MGREQLLVETFVDIVEYLVRGEDVDEFLRMVAERSAAVVSAAAVGIMLTDRSGTLRLASASTDAMHALEAFEIQSEEGPCFDAYTHGEQVIGTHLNATGAVERWPTFTPRALELGFGSVHAFPLRSQGQRLGALNVFFDTTGRFDESDVTTLQALADVASLSLIQFAERRHAAEVTDQLQTALDSRVVIEQAKGILSHDADISLSEAFTIIRACARNGQRSLRSVAEHVVQHRQLPPPCPDSSIPSEP